jgi:formate dehydrogenase major subunit
MPGNHGLEVLQAIDALLADKPDKVGHDFSEATRRLCAWRDQFIQRWRQTHSDEDRRNLERVNAAISVVVGGQFPLGSVPWTEIEKVRGDLADLASERTG